ncbi:MAG: S-layer homology domain-containing protein, partial [Clostridiaceae bacterium]|nr:S-layer homology domain-containing protein [Clostridiaceae bacterium]
MLAFACAFTMFAGAASFTDAADIEATEAVNMLTALGVIEGYEDGSFQPNGVVTRAEMAKMIFVIWNGGEDDASAYQSMNSAFGDTTTHWARGYINFCAANNIIAGVGNNRFNPDATVTGQEAAKMLLTIIGYDEDKAGLTGASWAQNTMSYAGLCGLFDDVQSPVEQGLPRQYAAQMIYNALDTNRVKWSTDSGSFDEITQWVGGTFQKETVGEKYMGYKTITGILVSANNGEGKGFKVLEQDRTNGAYNGTYNWSDNAWTESYYKTDLSQYLGEEIKVCYDVDEYANNRDSVFGVFSSDRNTVVTTTTNKVDQISEANKIKLDGTKYSIESSGTRYYSTTGDVDSTATDLMNTTPDNFSDIADEPQTANTIKFVDYDDNGKFDLAIEFPMTIAKVASVTSSTLTLKDAMGDDLATASPKLEDISYYEGMAKNDLVKITYDSFNDKVKVEKADTVDETIGAVRNDINDDNEEYNISAGWVKRYKNAAGEKVTTRLKSGDQATMVVINGIVYYADRTASGTGNDVAVVVNTGVSYSEGATGGNVEAKLMFADGKTEVVNVNAVISNVDNNSYDLSDITATGSANQKTNLAKLNAYLVGRDVTTSVQGVASYNAAITSSKAVTPALVTYSKTSDGYTLQLLDANENDAGYDDVLRGTEGNNFDEVTWTKATNSDSKIAGYNFDDNAVVYVVYGTSDVKKYTGSQAKKLDADGKTAYALIEKNNGLSRVKVAAIYMAAEPTIANTNTYAYVLDTTASTTIDGTSYIILTVYTENGAETLLAEKNATDRIYYAKGAVITLSYTGNTVSYGGADCKVVEDVNTQTAVEGAVTGWDGSDIQVLDVNGDVTSHDVDTDDTTVLVVDTDGKEGISVGKDGIDLATEVIDDVY